MVTHVSRERRHLLGVLNLLTGSGAGLWTQRCVFGFRNPECLSGARVRESEGLGWALPAPPPSSGKEPAPLPGVSGLWVLIVIALLRGSSHSPTGHSSVWADVAPCHGFTRMSSQLSITPRMNLHLPLGVTATLGPARLLSLQS